MLKEILSKLPGLSADPSLDKPSVEIPEFYNPFEASNFTPEELQWIKNHQRLDGTIHISFSRGEDGKLHPNIPSL